jgi:hypothetical protein
VLSHRLAIKISLFIVNCGPADVVLRFGSSPKNHSTSDARGIGARHCADLGVLGVLGGKTAKTQRRATRAE